MKITESKIPFNIRTIKVTKSRIEKGLLAVPVSLLDYFPKKKTKILISDGESWEFVQNTFTPYTSSSRECRIGGLKNFYQKYGVKDGDEIILQIMDNNKYRLFAENSFNKIVKDIEKKLDSTQNEADVENTIDRLSDLTKSSKEGTLLSEFYRLSRTRITQRGQNIRSVSTDNRTSPVIRQILGDIYKGKCQLTDFTFTMRNGKLYYEIHHIKPDLGDHPKNLLVVSPNIHAQFTHGFVQEHFDNDGWLRDVKLVDKEYPVFQIIDKIKLPFIKETHSEN